MIYLFIVGAIVVCLAWVALTTSANEFEKRIREEE